MGLSEEELNELPFYYGCIDSTKAVELLRLERPGSFLLRQSKNIRHKGTFTISVIKNRTAKSTEIYHFSVLGHRGHYYAKKGLMFDRILDLLEHYKTHDYENHLDIANIRLLYPVNKHDYVNAYSYATVESKFENLLAHLRQLDEETGEELCECGMLVAEAILPDGWMIHQTPDEPKRIFFQHDALNLTQWEIPNGLWGRATPNQRKLFFENGLAPS
ncbi:phosphatidylinositol 3-kinase regulatory subunit beta-like [Watersipora subatra]|uniref:phosphatidylinositol 3-kinase regulatory subunit beta-like n=1 Tax=Watersipora subatra TaxID=2589382 RepID=UPI00355B92D8